MLLQLLLENKLKKLKLQFFFLFLFSGLTIFAQDTIVTKKGEEIKSKIIEITSGTVKYQKYSNLEGPMYSISKEDIVFIKYENGEKDTFINEDSELINNDNELKIIENSFYQGNTPITRKELKRIIYTDEEARRQYKTGNFLAFSGLVLGTAGVTALLLDLLDDSDDYYYTEPDDTMLIIGIASSAVSIPLSLIGRSMKKKSIKKYNSNRNNVSYNFKIGYKRAGLVVSF